MFRSFSTAGLCALLPAAALFADHEAPIGRHPMAPETFTPWLTGPLIVPAGTVTPRGQVTIDPYLYFTVETGTYDKHWRTQNFDHNIFQIAPVVLTQIGITPWMDLQLIPQAVWNFTQHKSSLHFADLPAGFDFQLYPDDADEWIPGFKFSVIETFPTGKYHKLQPGKKRTDLSGAGTFTTTPSLTLYKIYHLHEHHFISGTFFLGYGLSSPVRVKGFNAYGGGYGTRGTVHPGALTSVILSFEYTLTQNWVLALDNVYTHVNKTTFKGQAGADSTGAPAAVGSPSSEQISFTPAIEYNFNESFGLIASSWFSAWGRNSIVFRSGVLGFVYSY